MIIPEGVKKIARNEKWLMAIPVRLLVADLRREVNRCSIINDCVNVALESSKASGFLETSIRPLQIQEKSQSF